MIVNNFRATIASKLHIKIFISCAEVPRKLHEVFLSGIGDQRQHCIFYFKFVSETSFKLDLNHNFISKRINFFKNSKYGKI